MLHSIADTPITLAVAKGRILKETETLLARAGIELTTDIATTRKLQVATTDPNLNLIILRASDVTTFVSEGAADLGIVGKDSLMEHGGYGLYECLDLGIARCTMVMAAPNDATHNATQNLAAWRNRAHVRIATKYQKIARAWLTANGIQADIIPLYGSMEIAPATGLADAIIDIMDTGNTLRANGLTAIAELHTISTRLIGYGASMKTRQVAPYIKAFETAISPK